MKYIPKKLIISITVLTIIAFKSLIAAGVFVPNDQPIGYIQPMTMSTFDLKNGAKGYRPWFENGAWQGDLIEYTITSSGGISTSVDLSQITPTNSGSNWSARMAFSNAESDSNYWQNLRKIITHNGSNQIAFKWTSLTEEQKRSLDSANINNASSPILNYVRGDRSREQTGDYRKRYNLLGDIIHSNPIYVGAPDSNINESSYIAFKNDNLNRAPRIYVGANDGMLHVFDAVNGKEVYAFIPPSLMPKLSKLKEDPYFHDYYVDGELSVHDAYFNSKWHTVLIGNLGAGGTARFALDITNPNLSSETSNSGSDNKVLWIKDASDNSALGYSFGNSSTALLPDGKFYSISGNGYYSTSNTAQLVLTNIATGDITTINTSVGSDGAPNGLSTPSLIDNDGDGIYDYAYAGDLLGNVWKFDLENKALAYRDPLYSGNATQPITTKPTITFHPNGGKLVYVASGKSLLESDLTDTSAQVVLGLWDKGGAVNTRKILAQSLQEIQSLHSQNIRTISNNTINWNDHEGWKIELNNGQKVLTNHQLRDGRLQLTVTNPVNSENWIFEPAYINGGAPYTTLFDLNNDGSLDASDNVSSSVDRLDIAVMWQVASGVMSAPLIARITDGIDTKFVNYEELTAAPIACTEGCGFLGGHIDVDTDSDNNGNGFAGETTAHTHEYDKIVNQPYVDYFQVNDGSGKQLQVDEVLSDNQKFIIIVANADLSSKSELHIGTNTYNILEYQKMIHQKLSAWDYASKNYSSLVDNNDNPLVVTINDIQKNGGTLRNAFDNHSILDGGLHPTQTGCVKKSPSITKDRWRNGALITQLVDIEKLSSFSDLYLQNPDDLPDSKETNIGTVILKEDDVIYGGLRVKGESSNNSPNNGFLYESTLFWHYDGSCYGDSKWEEDVANARENETSVEYTKLLEDKGFDSYQELVDEIEELETLCQENNIKGKQCDDSKGAHDMKLKDLKRLKRQVDEAIDDSGGTPGTEPGTGEIGGIPLAIIGGNISTGVTAGPNFIRGRRTWVDITN